MAATGTACRGNGFTATHRNPVTNPTSPASSKSPPDKGPYLSVVLPCYNDSEVIRETHRRVAAVCGDLKQPYKIVVVNDGSKDSTWAQLRELAQEDEHLVAVNLSRNHGHQLALSAGLHFARGERILTWTRTCRIRRS